MPKRQPNIRWRQRDLDELQRTIKNVNAKIGRLEKKNPDRKDALPARFSKDKLMSEIETRSDYNRIIESLQKFSSLRNAGKLPDKNAKIQKTAWEIKFQSIRAEIAQRKMKERAVELSTKVKKQGGVKTDHPVVGMGEVRENALRPLDPNLQNKKSTDAFERAVRHIDSILNKETIAKKQELMVKNYIKGLTENELLNDPEYAKELMKYIKGVSYDTFVNTVIEDEYGTFEWYKDEHHDREIRKQTILRAWKSAFEEEQGEA